MERVHVVAYLLNTKICSGEYVVTWTVIHLVK